MSPDVVLNEYELDAIRTGLARLETIHQYLNAWRNDGFDEQTVGKKMTMHIRLELKMPKIADQVRWSREVLAPARSRLNETDNLHQMCTNGIAQTEECNEMANRFQELAAVWVGTLNPVNLLYIMDKLELAKENAADGKAARDANVQGCVESSVGQ